MVFGDGHVHLHPGFDLDFLFRRVQEQADRLGGPLVLALMAPRGGAVPGDLGRMLRRSGDLEVRSLADPGALRILCAEAPAPQPVFIAPGRQFVSSDRLEVLALGWPSDASMDDVAANSLSTEDVLRRVLDSGAAAILPWGVGKWTGRRGRIVTQIVAREEFSSHPLFLLGDIARRMRGWPAPKAFAGPVRVLAGSDPLDLPGNESRVARYGFRIEGSLDFDHPVASLLALLRRGGKIGRFGSRGNACAVLWDEVRYRGLRGSRPA